MRRPARGRSRSLPGRTRSCPAWSVPFSASGAPIYQAVPKPKPAGAAACAAGRVPGRVASPPLDCRQAITIRWQHRRMATHRRACSSGRPPEVGAAATAFLFPILLADIGTTTVLYLLAGTSLLGAAITWRFASRPSGTAHGTRRPRLGRARDIGAFERREPPDHDLSGDEDRAALVRAALGAGGAPVRLGGDRVQVPGPARATPSRYWQNFADR